MKAKRLFVTTILTICILAGFTSLNRVNADLKDTDKDLYKDIELFSDAVTIIQSDYVEDVESKKIVYGALEGMLASLDEYSQFMDPDSYKEMEVETKGEFGGLGIEISVRDGILTVIAPIDGTPAHKAGIKAKDKIVGIDGEPTRDITLSEAVKKLRGKPKTKIDLKILREGEEKLLDFTVVRDIIRIKSIKISEMIDENIGYIRLVEFQENTPEELEDKLRRLEDDKMAALILDLRNNPGGLLDVAYEVSDIFLPKGKVVVSLKGRVPIQNKVYLAHGKRSFTNFPLVVLVNEGSASASEIVAGALQDNKRGIILGSKTFGKGSVQTVIPLRDGSAVRLTTASYYTPSGNSISHKGIMPDIEVKLEEPEAKETDETDQDQKVQEEPTDQIVYDNQLQAAIDMLKKDFSLRKI